MKIKIKKTEHSQSNHSFVYPVLPFQNGLEVAKAVCDAGGANSGVQKSVIAHALKSSETSGGFIQRLGTARIYGMIEGRGDYRLTEGAKRYFFPSSDTEKRHALLALINSAPIFAEIIKRFDGNRVPTGDMLANVLLREFGIPESWKVRVARFFSKAASDAGILDNQGFLRYSSALHTLDGMPGTSSNNQAATQQRDAVSSTSSSQLGAERAGMNAWVFSLKGKTVRVETSDELSPELWQKLDAYIKVLKPFEVEISS
jgi:hypothetical protein